MLNGTSEEEQIVDEAVAGTEATDRLAENLQVLRAQAHELVVRFGISDPELLAAVLKVTQEEARTLLDGQAP